jgi:hypothetical protein
MLNVVKNLFRRPSLEKVPDTIFTDDFWKLEQYMFQLIFVADELKRGGKYHSFIAEHSRSPEPVHPSCYTSGEYHFFKKDLGEGHSFPFALPSNYKPSAFLRYPPEPARIKGELWAIRPKAFISLDIHRQNGVMFRRERVRITYPTTPIAYSTQNPLPHILPDQIATVMAWMYIGIPTYWDDQIGGIFQNQLELREHEAKKIWIDKFYKFDV